ncbi:MAG: nicotinamide mononucleotide transporter [Paludibacteraceae bacterium]|nr:nicotinamide mononucleotide transporter [Paludibacteraceae bacterium]
MKNAGLWRSMSVNLVISVALFVVFFFLLRLLELLFPSLSLLHFDDLAWCVGVPASVIGVGYVLTIRDPKNYTGFYPGIVMSALLAWQCFLQGNIDLTILYVCVFIPFQVKSVIAWVKGNNNVAVSDDVSGSDSKAADSGPSFLSPRQRWLSVLFFVVMIIADYLIVTCLLQGDSLLDGVAVKLFGAIMIASATLANFWLIYRKTDAWLYWVIYSFSGIVFFALVGNVFSVLLFCFFLVINSMAGIAWLKA